MVDALFAILLFASCAYAWSAGGKEGRWTASTVVGAAVLSIPASLLDRGWSHTQLPVLGVDLLLLFALLAIALRSERFWPLWMAAFHMISVSTHVATIALPGLRPIIYFAMQSFWSLPLLLAMVVGILLDRRAGLPAPAFGAIRDDGDGNSA